MDTRIKELVQRYADQQFSTGCWSEEEQFRDDMDSMARGENEELINGCIEDLEYEGIIVDRDDSEMMSTIISILTKDAAKKLKTYKSKDFELPTRHQ